MFASYSVHSLVIFRCHSESWNIAMGSASSKSVGSEESEGHILGNSSNQGTSSKSTDPEALPMLAFCQDEQLAPGEDELRNERSQALYEHFDRLAALNQRNKEDQQGLQSTGAVNTPLHDVKQQKQSHFHARHQDQDAREIHQRLPERTQEARGRLKGTKQVPQAEPSSLHSQSLDSPSTPPSKWAQEIRKELRTKIAGSAAYVN